MGTSDDDAIDRDDEPGTGTSSDEVIKWKRLARKHEDRWKALKAELDELKARASSSEQSDMDKLRSTIEQLRSELAEERHKNLVAEVAAAKGLTPRQARWLRGKTREELEDEADEILEAFGARPKPAMGTSDQPGKGDPDDDNRSDEDGQAGDDGSTGSGARSGRGRPREKLIGGASSASDTDTESGEELAEQVWKRTRGAA